MKKVVLAFISLFISTNTFSLTFPILSNSDIIGMVQTVRVQSGDTLYKIARKFDVGVLELIEANPKINPDKLQKGTTLTIPTAYILPSGPRTGIVLNLAELRVYYYHPGQKLVSTHPVGIGRLGWRTPVGETKIIRKRKDPDWRPPASIRKVAAKQGTKLPAVVPAGPNNPLGAYAMNLGWARYLIHGTNKPTSVGFRSSSGCIRMYPEDIESLFYKVKVGTSVRIVHEPIKAGWRNSHLYLEAHDPLKEKYYGFSNSRTVLNQVVNNVTLNRMVQVNWGDARQEVRQTFGYPVRIY